MRDLVPPGAVAFGKAVEEDQHRRIGGAFIDDVEVDAIGKLHALLFKRSYHESAFRAKMEAIKLLVIDVDGVMTDGGMYFTESGDQFKKFNTKDGMGIIHLTRDDFQVAIISSGFKGAAVKARAELLGIQNCYVALK